MEEPDARNDQIKTADISNIVEFIGSYVGRCNRPENIDYNPHVDCIAEARVCIKIKFFL